MKPLFIELKGNQWLCPVCSNKYRKKSQCEYHIKKHPKQSLLSSLKSWLGIKDKMIEVSEYRKIKESERRKKI